MTQLAAQQRQLAALASDLEALAAAARRNLLSRKAVARLAAAIEHAGACDRRDAALRRAGELVHPVEGEPHARAEALERALVRFRRDAWGQIEAGVREPRGGLEEALTVAFRCSLTVPGSARHLYRILVC